MTSVRNKGTKDMPVSRYERLDEKMEKVLAILGEHTTYHALNSQEHEHIVKGMGTLVEQGKIRNGRLDKVECRAGKLEAWRSWMIGGGAAIGVIGKVLFDLFTK